VHGTDNGGRTDDGNQRRSVPYGGPTMTNAGRRVIAASRCQQTQHWAEALIDVDTLLLRLTLCQLQGFPYGTKPGEEERVSLPNAKYTQGNYEVSDVFTLVSRRTRSTTLSTAYIWCLPHDAVHNHGLCRRAVSVRLSVRPGIYHVRVFCRNE